MSTDTQYGRITFICDECDETLETDTRNISNAWHAAKEEGWLAFKDDDTGEWTHVCPDCIPRMRP